MAEENPAKESRIRIAEELPVTAVDFIKQESWDSFFTSKGADDFCEWYADWPQFRTSLISHLSFPAPAQTPEKLSILVPACGASRLSEHLYDEGFRNITNVDFSKVVIQAMMKRNIKVRPEMRWRVMDITNIQFRFGWKINLYTIYDEASPGTNTQQTFMLVAEKSFLTVVSRIAPFMDVSFLESQGNQVKLEYRVSSIPVSFLMLLQRLDLFPINFA
ncbi:hypothetical protein MIMGU_mgv11b017246mg [Erythranthe guttata]|uniref:Uncharacterized protein n=1 Tax=Erythranthe guttata TaxID=4155 RepID=A0A022QZ09_ERYGU|nr:hypothetical protein MIMGU_mgv11b017246mg [Erythranthe guttata]